MVGFEVILKLNKKIEYALIVLKHLSNIKQGQLSTAREISTLYRSTFDVTSKVMQNLAQKGILKSEQGAYGGYQIAGDLSKITMLEIIESILGEIEITKCKDEQCVQNGFCNIYSSIEYLNKKITEFYKNITVSEIINAKDIRKSKKTNNEELNGKQ